MLSYTFLLPRSLIDSNLVDSSSGFSCLAILHDSGLFWLYADNLFYLKGFESRSYTFICTVRRDARRTKFFNCRETKIMNFTSMLDFSPFFDYKKSKFPISNLDFEGIESIKRIFADHQAAPSDSFLHFPPMVAKISIPKPISSIAFHKSSEKKKCSRSDRRSNYWYISFDSTPPKAPSIPEDVDQSIYTSLMLLFNQRPAWTKLGIMNSIEALDPSKLKKLKKRSLTQPTLS